MSNAKKLRSPRKGADRRRRVADQWAPFGPPPILEGEDTTAYNNLLAQITAAVNPTDIFEKMWIGDIVDLQWDILRLRRLKGNLLISTASEPLASALEWCLEQNMEEPDEPSGESEVESEDENRDVDHGENKESEEGEELSNAEIAEYLADGWSRRQPDAVKEVGQLMDSANLTLDTVMAHVFVENLDNIERIEGMIAMAERRRNAVLTEISRHRSTLAQALCATVSQIDADESHVVPLKSIENQRRRR